MGFPRGWKLKRMYHSAEATLSSSPTRAGSFASRLDALDDTPTSSVDKVAALDDTAASSVDATQLSAALDAAMVDGSMPVNKSHRRCLSTWITTLDCPEVQEDGAATVSQQCSTAS